jgi:L-fucose mutarotase
MEMTRGAALSGTFVASRKPEAGVKENQDAGNTGNGAIVSLPPTKPPAPTPPPTLAEIEFPMIHVVPVELAEVMEPARTGAYPMKNDPPIFEDFRKILGARDAALDLAKLERCTFHDAAGTQDVTRTIATGEQRICANVLRTIGVVQ